MAIHFGWLRRSAPAPLVRREREVWSLVNADHAAKVIVQTTPLGRELRAEVDGHLRRARLFRVGEPGLPAVVAAWLDAFEAHGWTLAAEQGAREASPDFSADPQLQLHCPRCGELLLYCRTSRGTHFYQCSRHGLLILPRDGRVRPALRREDAQH